MVVAHKHHQLPQVCPRKFRAKRFLSKNVTLWLWRCFWVHAVSLHRALQRLIALRKPNGRTRGVPWPPVLEPSVQHGRRRACKSSNSGKRCRSWMAGSQHLKPSPDKNSPSKPLLWIRQGTNIAQENMVPGTLQSISQNAPAKLHTPKHQSRRRHQRPKQHPRQQSQTTTCASTHCIRQCRTPKSINLAKTSQPRPKLHAPLHPAVNLAKTHPRRHSTVISAPNSTPDNILKHHLRQHTLHPSMSHPQKHQSRENIAAPPQSRHSTVFSAPNSTPDNIPKHDLRLCTLPSISEKCALTVTCMPASTQASISPAPQTAPSPANPFPSLCLTSSAIWEKKCSLSNPPRGQQHSHCSRSNPLVAVGVSPSERHAH